LIKLSGLVTQNKKINEMAYSSPDAQKAIQKDLKVFSDLLGKASQKVI
jgi:hypothetical protein